jgi:hypothetical protein
MDTNPYASGFNTVAARGPWVELLQEDALLPTADRARARHLLAEPAGPSREMLWYLGSSAVSVAFGVGLLLGLAAGF